jgi:hypothetical protein
MDWEKWMANALPGEPSPEQVACAGCNVRFKQGDDLRMMVDVHIGADAWVPTNKRSYHRHCIEITER